MDRGGISSELILEKIRFFFYDEESQEFPVCFGLRERHFQRIAGRIHLSVDLKYDGLCLLLLVYGIPT